MRSERGKREDLVSLSLFPANGKPVADVKEGIFMGVCRVRALIPAPLAQVWEVLIRPEYMHLWGPLTQPVTEFDRPLRVGDRVTQARQDFFRRYTQVLLLEEIVPRDAQRAKLK